VASQIRVLLSLGECEVVPYHFGGWIEFEEALGHKKLFKRFEVLMQRRVLNLAETFIPCLSTRGVGFSQIRGSRVQGP
jgi:hypothetical protein